MFFFSLDGSQLVEVKAAVRSQEFTISAHLSGGRGDVAWQHTQLFRQSLDDTHGRPFTVKITLQKL